MNTGGAQATSLQNIANSMALNNKNFSNNVTKSQKLAA